MAERLYQNTPYAEPPQWWRRALWWVGGWYVDAARWERDHKQVVSEADELAARVEALEAQRDEALRALEQIEGLKARWDAPLSHEPGDWGEAAWAAVGSEAHKIATDARRRILSGDDQ